MFTTRWLVSFIYFVIFILLVMVIQTSIKLYDSFPIDTTEIDLTDKVETREFSLESAGNVETIVSSQMFYVPKVVESSVSSSKKEILVKKIVDTKLNLKLTGLITGNNSVAVISYNGKQRPYATNEMIVDSHRLKVLLVAIEGDHIIIENNGVEERLVLPKNRQQSIDLSGIIKQ